MEEEVNAGMKVRAGEEIERKRTRKKMEQLERRLESEINERKEERETWKEMMQEKEKKMRWRRCRCTWQSIFGR